MAFRVAGFRRRRVVEIARRDADFGNNQFRIHFGRIASLNFANFHGQAIESGSIEDRAVFEKGNVEGSRLADSHVRRVACVLVDQRSVSAIAARNAIVSEDENRSHSAILHFLTVRSKRFYAP